MSFAESVHVDVCIFAPNREAYVVTVAAHSGNDLPTVLGEYVQEEKHILAPQMKTYCRNVAVYCSDDLPAILGEYVWIQSHVLAPHRETMQRDGDTKPGAVLGERDGGGARVQV